MGTTKTRRKSTGRPRGMGLATGELKKWIRRKPRWTAPELVKASGCTIGSARESLRRYAAEGLLERVKRGVYRRAGS